MKSERYRDKEGLLSDRDVPLDHHATKATVLDTLLYINNEAPLQIFVVAVTLDRLQGGAAADRLP